MSIADLIFIELRRRQISLRELAGLAGVSHSTLSKIVNHGQQPTTATLRKLAPVLGRPEDELLEIAGHRTGKQRPARQRSLTEAFAEFERMLPRTIQLIMQDWIDDEREDWEWSTTIPRGVDMGEIQIDPSLLPDRHDLFAVEVEQYEGLDREEFVKGQLRLGVGKAVVVVAPEENPPLGSYVLAAVLGEHLAWGRRVRDRKSGADFIDDQALILGQRFVPLGEGTRIIGRVVYAFHEYSDGSQEEMNPEFPAESAFVEVDDGFGDSVAQGIPNEDTGRVVIPIVDQLPGEGDGFQGWPADQIPHGVLSNHLELSADLLPLRRDLFAYQAKGDYPEGMIAKGDYLVFSSDTSQQSGNHMLAVSGEDVVFGRVVWAKDGAGKDLALGKDISLPIDEHLALIGSLVSVYRRVARPDVEEDPTVAGEGQQQQRTSEDQQADPLRLSPAEFETTIRDILSVKGLEVRQAQALPDGGLDAVAHDTRGGVVLIQAKYRGSALGADAVRDLLRAVQDKGASKGILVTTGGLTKEVYDFAQDKPLELIDGKQVLRLLKEHMELHPE